MFLLEELVLLVLILLVEVDVLLTEDLELSLDGEVVTPLLLFGVVDAGRLTPDVPDGLLTLLLSELSFFVEETPGLYPLTLPILVILFLLVLLALLPGVIVFLLPLFLFPVTELLFSLAGLA